MVDHQSSINIRYRYVDDELAGTQQLGCDSLSRFRPIVQLADALELDVGLAADAPAVAAVDVDAPDVDAPLVASSMANVLS